MDKDNNRISFPIEAAPREIVLCEPGIPAEWGDMGDTIPTGTIGPIRNFKRNGDMVMFDVMGVSVAFEVTDGMDLPDWLKDGSRVEANFVFATIRRVSA